MQIDQPQNYSLELKAPRATIYHLQPVVQAATPDNKFICFLQQLSPSRLGIRVKTLEFRLGGLAKAPGNLYVCIDHLPVHCFTFRLDEGRHDEIFIIPESVSNLSTNPNRISYRLEINSPNLEKALRDKFRQSIEAVINNPEYRISLNSLGRNISTDHRICCSLQQTGFTAAGDLELSLTVTADRDTPLHDPALSNGRVIIRTLDPEDKLVASHAFHLQKGRLQNKLIIPNPVKDNGNGRSNPLNYSFQLDVFRNVERQF